MNRDESEVEAIIEKAKEEYGGYFDGEPLVAQPELPAPPVMKERNPAIVLQGKSVLEREYTNP